MIPRRMAFYWSGERMSYMRYLTLHTFRVLNPDWEIIVYHGETTPSRSWNSWERLDTVDFDGDDYSPLVSRLGVKHREIIIPIETPSPTFASDLCSYEYLGTIGGWYADMDVLWIRPMSDIDPLTRDAGAVFCLTEGVMGIGFLAGKPNCRLWHGVHGTAIRNYRPGNYQSCGIISVHEHLQSVATARKMYPSVNVVEVPSHTVYPWSATNVKRIFRQSREVPNGCIGIHWFGGHPESQVMNNRLNHKTVNHIRCTFTRYAQEFTFTRDKTKLT